MHSPGPLLLVDNGTARTQEDQTDSDHLRGTSDMITSEEPKRRKQSKQTIKSGDGVVVRPCYDVAVIDVWRQQRPTRRQTNSRTTIADNLFTDIFITTAGPCRLGSDHGMCKTTLAKEQGPRPAHWNNLEARKQKLLAANRVVPLQVVIENLLESREEKAARSSSSTTAPQA